MPHQSVMSTGKRVLVLDDDPLTGETICQIAEFAGYETLYTRSHVEFFEQIESWQPHLLTLDLLMPEMDGVEVLSRLSKMSHTVGIIIVSGVGQRVLDAAIRSAKEHGLGVLGGLSKPFSPAQLRALLAKPVGPSYAGGYRKSKHTLSPSEADLREAIRAKQLSVVFQPKVFCKTGTLAGFEALARWQWQGTPIPPDYFIELAEENGLIDELTECIFEQALHWFAGISHTAWEEKQGKVALLHTTLSLNLSALTLPNQGLFQWLVEQCDSLGVERKRLILELTESTAMRDPADSLQTLTRLRMQGFQLSRGFPPCCNWCACRFPK